MQLGTRWSVGATPPERLSEDVVSAIREVESRVPATEAGALRWTLTWLEGHPIAELDRIPSTREVFVVREDYDGSVAITVED